MVMDSVDVPLSFEKNTDMFGHFLSLYFMQPAEDGSSELDKEMEESETAIAETVSRGSVC